MIHAYNAMRGSGKAVSVTLMALALTDAGVAAAYAPMELDEPSECEEEEAIGPAFGGAIAPPAADKEAGQADRGGQVGIRQSQKEDASLGL